MQFLWEPALRIRLRSAEMCGKRRPTFLLHTLCERAERVSRERALCKRARPPLLTLVQTHGGQARGPCTPAAEGRPRAWLPRRPACTRTGHFASGGPSKPRQAPRLPPPHPAGRGGTQAAQEGVRVSEHRRGGRGWPALVGHSPAPRRPVCRPQNIYEAQGVMKQNQKGPADRTAHGCF